MKKFDFLLDCTVVILSYNTKDITDICISKVLEAKKMSKKSLHNKVAIIVVDNGSKDGTVAMIQHKYKSVHLIALKENLGVSKGYNKGMKAAKTPYILIINSDTYLEKNTLVESLRYMQIHQQTDVLMVKLTDQAGSFRPYGGHVPTPFKIITWQLGLESLPIIKNFIPRIYCYNTNFYKNGGNIEWVPTCYFFLRRDVFKKTGGHDENIFLYMDDVEWCKRIKDHKFTITFTPTINAVHIGGASTEKKMEAAYLLQRQINGLMHYINKHYPHSVRTLMVFLRTGSYVRAGFYLLIGNTTLAKAYATARFS